MYCLLFILEQAIWQNTALIFQEFTNMSKITHTKKVIEDKYIFRSDFKVRQEVNGKIQTIISYIKDELQIPLKIIYLVKK